jgi:hypothetical protein
MTATTSAQVHKLTEGSFLVCSPQGNVLFGCPPEILKRILAQHLPMPDTVVVPSNLHHFHSSQASLEFPLYHFLFVQRGLERNRKFQVVASPEQCSGLERLLSVTVLGPKVQEMVKAGCTEDMAREIFQETHFLSLKNPKTHEQYQIPEMINFFPLETGKRCNVYPQRGKLPDVLVQRDGDAKFRLLFGEESVDLDLSVTAPQTPNYEIKHKPFDAAQDRFSLTVLGRSNGFDPRDPANGYVLNLGGRIVVWDCPAYLNLHLEKLKLDYKKVDALVLSHVHEDHLDAVESLRDPPLELWATPEVYFSLLVKLSALYNCSLEDAKRFHKWHRIDVGKPVEICGARFDFFHSVHAIPAIGSRIESKSGGKTARLTISGDHLSKAALESMRSGGGISPRRFEQMSKLIKGDEDLVLVDAGGGAIHGDYRDYLDSPMRIAFMHTGLIQEALPPNMKLVESGEVLDVLPR